MIHAGVERADPRLRTLFQVARLLAARQDLDTLLFGFLSCLAEGWEAAEAGLLLLYDPADDRMAARAAYGYHLSPLGQLRVAPGEGISGKAFQAGQTIVYSTPEEIATARANLAPANREMLRAACAGQREPHSATCIPLIAAGAPRPGEPGQQANPPVVGVLVLEGRKEGQGLAQADLDFFQEMAQLYALAVQSDRARHERESVQAREETSRLKAGLISTLAHEMRTPLTSIKGYSTALLLEEASFGPETRREFLEIIDQECDVLQELIHDLLESSAIDAGLLKLDPQPVMLHRLIPSLVDEMARRTRRHRFVVDFPRAFPVVEADPTRIDQVLRNLLDNAIKYSPEGGMIVVRGQVEEERVVISVADQGVGIAPEHLNRLFEKFFRVESSLGHHVVGSGLGLPIARTIVEGHGGRIWAESKLGEGSTFYFTLPLIKPAP
jgi:signal transduction histidine kinase